MGGRRSEVGAEVQEGGEVGEELCAILTLG